MKFFLSALICAVLGLTACTGPKKLGGLTATPQSIRVISPTEVRITIRLDNENVTALGIDTSIHKLSLNGTYVGQGVSKVPIGIVAMTSATQDVTFTLDNPAFLRGLGDMSTVAYSIDSLMKLTSGETRFELKSHTQGAVPISGLDKAK